jgi:sugar O-acyltransferase (sialic acid O-acetyltransferase NeuD family)
MTRVYVAGTRTFAAEAAEFAADAGLEVAGLLEPYDRDRVGTTIHDLPVAWLEDTEPGIAVLGTGEPDRRPIVTRLEQAGWRLATVVHPRAHLARTVTVGDGTIVGPGVIVGARSSLGAHVLVARGVLVGHHTEIDDFVTLNPGANVAGNVRLERDVTVGMAAVVRDHLSIGESALIAAGAVVVRDVDPAQAVRGVPAQAYEQVGSGTTRERARSA